MYGVVVQGCQSSILSECFETKNSKILKKNFMMNSLRKFWIFEEKKGFWDPFLEGRKTQTRGVSDKCGKWGR